MRLVTFSSEAVPALGVLGDQDDLLDVRSLGVPEADTMLGLIEGGADAMKRLQDAVGRAEPGAWRPAASIQLLAPIPQMRRNVFCVGRNYKLHIQESARAKGVPLAYPSVPEFFTKPTTAVVGHGAGVARNAALTGKLDYEVELAIVIGSRLRDATKAQAGAAVFGYTIVNDVSARDMQMAHNQWFKGKALDTFCPIGPCIVTAEAFGDPAGHRITLRVNGETRQDSTTADLLFSVEDIIVSLSSGQTLLPGDIIATGTPAGVAFGMAAPAYLQVGDVMEAEVAGIGILRNPIVD